MRHESVCYANVSISNKTIYKMITNTNLAEGGEQVSQVLVDTAAVATGMIGSTKRRVVALRSADSAGKASHDARETDRRGRKLRRTDSARRPPASRHAHCSVGTRRLARYSINSMLN